MVVSYVTLIKFLSVFFFFSSGLRDELEEVDGLGCLWARLGFISRGKGEVRKHLRSEENE